MCGVARDTVGQSDTAPPLEAAMPPSITLGSEPPKPAGGPGEHPPHQEPPPSRDIPTIDLSCDENDDLQKAIALSLQDQEGVATLGVSAEEQEVSRALEASLKDSQPQATVDLLNPRERRRLPGRPVGLKNIGNSCWFNVVLQPLFHIPVFRDLILDFPQSLEAEDHGGGEDGCKASQLVPALRRLFALMIGSHRKYVDPSAAVQVFQGQEMRRNAQQDVCEFTHKLLERLEEEFQQLLRRQGVEKESCGRHISKDADFDNPIMKLFYGQAKKETCDAPTQGEQQQQQQEEQPQHQQQHQDQQEGPKQEAFGQYPLRVTNYHHIHDSILASMSSGAPAGAGPNVPPRQETWFKMLPPVLIFSLSRYEYSHEKKRAEKVHNKFEFPEFLYMDRYMEANKQLVRQKQVRVAALQTKLRTLHTTLDRYLKYGSGAAQYPIADILRYTLDFAQTGRSGSEVGQDAPSPPMMEVDGSEDDVEMAEDGPSPPPRDLGDEGEEVEASGDAGNGEQQKQQPQQVPSPSKRMRLLPPVPRSISGPELTTLQGCLTRWLRDITAQVEELRRLIAELQQQLSQVYEEPALLQVPYRLHAAVVHEGQASAGHYWAYIHDAASGGWMKYNDIQVAESSWQEVLQDSVGGHNNTSAYCLLYIDQGRYPTLFPSAPKSQEDLLAGLALDLQEHIKADNQAFARELEEWDAHQENLLDQAPPSPPRGGEATSAPPPVAPGSPDVVCLRVAEESKFFMEMETMLPHMLREGLTTPMLPPVFRDFYELLRYQLARLENLDTGQPDSGTSLLDFAVYLMRNMASDCLLQLYGCKVAVQVTRSITPRTPLVERVEREAAHLLCQWQEKQRRGEGGGSGLYRGWLRHYRSLVDCAWHLVYGHQQQQRGALEAALPHLLRAHQIHCDLQKRAPAGTRKTLDGRVLCRARSSCLLALNRRLVDTFVEGEAQQLVEIPGVVTSLIVPAIAQLVASDTEEDRTTLEEVRAPWCNQLGHDVPPTKSKIMEQLLVPILNTGAEARGGGGPFQTPRPPNVLQLYKEYTKCCSLIMADPGPAPASPTPTPTPTKAQTSDL